MALLISLAAGTPQDVRAQAEAALVIDPVELADDKQAKRAQAAHVLLKAIHTGQPSIARRHRKFLAEILSPEALRSGEVSWISASSIVEELQSWIPREDLPYPEVAADLLPLIGVGGPEFRKIVIQAVNVLVTYEMEKGQSSPTLDKLKTQLSQRVPTEGVLLDAVAVLWENDPRAALTSLVTALEIYSADEADETMMWACLKELKARVSVYFPTPELWRKWWKRVEKLPLEKMLVEYQRETVTDYTANWRRIMERLKETQDAERVLSAVRDTLQRNSVELRLAAVNALGAYPQWVLEIPLRREQSKDSKAPFLKRGAEALLGVIEREQFPLESPDVIQAALVSLRMYQNLSETAPDVYRRLSENVVNRLRKFSREGCMEAGIYRETVRVAGALRVTEALPHIEAYLTKTALDRSAELEFLSSAVLALGQLVDGAGMSREMAELVINLFQEPRAGSDQEIQNLRLVCMIALERGAGNQEIRRRLLGFYKQALVEHKDAVIPVRAILGLGTLVKVNEADALQTMVEILENREQYSLDAVLAVVDSIASYVLPAKALHRFLPFLVAQEVAIRDRLWSKVLGLVETGGLSNAALASREMLMLGVDNENPRYFEAAEDLFAEAPLVALLDPQKLDLASQRQVTPWWKTMLSLVRIHDLRRQYGGGGTEEEDLAAARMMSLGELLRQNDALRKDHSEAVSEFEKLEEAFRKRTELLPRIGASGGGDPAQLAREFGVLLEIEKSALGRRSHLLWIERQLGAIKSADRLESLRDACRPEFLNVERNAGVWDGLPDTFRVRYMSRLKDLRAASPPAPSPPTGSPEKAKKES